MKTTLRETYPKLGAKVVKHSEMKCVLITNNITHIKTRTTSFTGWVEP